MTAFRSFGKVPRLNRDIVITEKIDGTNAQVIILEECESLLLEEEERSKIISYDDGPMGRVMLAGSRNRLITPDDDNFGFARWVSDNSDELWSLDPGRHFGEWWGSGIQRGYGLTNGDKRFSLFNTNRWKGNSNGAKDWPPLCCSVVPVLYQGPFTKSIISETIERLGEFGSCAELGFSDPEGIMVYHTAARHYFKVTLQDDEKPKGSKE